MTGLSPKIETLLDNLSMGLVMADPDDLIALGDVLDKIENLSDLLSREEYIPSIHILTGLRLAVEAVILDKVQDKGDALQLVGRGVGLLQEIVRDLGAGKPIGGDIQGFVTALEQRLGITIPAAPDKVDSPDTREAAGLSGEDGDVFFHYISESVSLIESMEVSVISLEQNPEDQEVLEAVIRPFHILKTVSGFLKIKPVHGVIHRLENILEDARGGRLTMTARVIDLVLDGVDLLKQMIADLKTELETGSVSENRDRVEVFHRRLDGVGRDEPEEEPGRPAPSYSGLKLGEILIDQGIVTEEELEQVLEQQEAGRLRRLGDMVVERGLITPADLETALERQLEASDKKLGEILVETGKAAPEDIDQSLHDQEILKEQKLGELLIREKRAGAREITSALRDQKKRTDDQGISIRTVKVDTGKLDQLVDMVGELVIAQSLVKSNERVIGFKDQKLQRDLSHMGRITSDLQRVAMSMRMVPIRQTFQKMIRLVRDLSRKSGKPVELGMSGEETEIDRNMVEAIYDPLVHMVRNSVDHGIEIPEIRKSNGKSAQGNILLSAYHQGGNVIIEIHDDGQGLNREKILKKAIERNLVGPEEHLSDSAVYNLVFQPGFSTADTVTDVSGRGVGMDVVKRAIEKLRGKIEVHSTFGRGSRITIRLPLTLAIIDGMIVRVGNHRYILPTVSIHESFRPGKEDYHTVKGRGEMIRVRRQLLPLVRLDRILDMQCMVSDPTEALVIVVENNNERRCIMVDEVIGKQEVVIKSLGESLKHIRSLAGGSILGDGRVGLILDVAGMFEVSDAVGGGPVPVAAAGGGLGDPMPGDPMMDDDWGM